MSENEGGLLSCRNTSWIAGALIGLVAFLLLLGAGLVWAVIVGLVLGVAVALVLLRLFCADAGPGMPHHVVARTAAVTTGAGASSSLAHDASARAAADAAASAMMGDEETASGIAAEGGRSTPAAALDAAAVAADMPAHGRAEPAPEPKAKPEAATAPATTKTATATEKPARKPVAKDGKPELFDAPEGAADDLKLIKGVGPKLEEKLNALGVWHYAQIAGWRKKEVEWVDTQLSFKGRIERDDWIKQAKALAKGEATEFSKRASKSGMYDKN